MSRNQLPFAIVPILVRGEQTGYVYYVSGQYTDVVTFEVHCLSQTKTQEMLLRIYKEACQLKTIYESGGETVFVYSVSLKLNKWLLHPKPYILGIARSIAACTTHELEALEDTARAHAYTEENDSK